MCGGPVIFIYLMRCCKAKAITSRNEKWAVVQLSVQHCYLSTPHLDLISWTSNQETSFLKLAAKKEWKSPRMSALNQSIGAYMRPEQKAYDSMKIAQQLCERGKIVVLNEKWCTNFLQGTGYYKNRAAPPQFGVVRDGSAILAYKLPTTDEFVGKSENLQEYLAKLSSPASQKKLLDTIKRIENCKVYVPMTWVPREKLTMNQQKAAGIMWLVMIVYQDNIDMAYQMIMDFLNPKSNWGPWRNEVVRISNLRSRTLPHPDNEPSPDPCKEQGSAEELIKRTGADSMLNETAISGEQALDTTALYTQTMKRIDQLLINREDDVLKSRLRTWLINQLCVEKKFVLIAPDARKELKIYKSEIRPANCVITNDFTVLSRSEYTPTTVIVKPLQWLTKQVDKNDAAAPPPIQKISLNQIGRDLFERMHDCWTNSNGVYIPVFRIISPFCDCEVLSINGVDENQWIRCYLSFLRMFSLNSIDWTNHVDKQILMKDKIEVLDSRKLDELRRGILYAPNEPPVSGKQKRKQLEDCEIKEKRRKDCSMKLIEGFGEAGVVGERASILQGQKTSTSDLYNHPISNTPITAATKATGWLSDKSGIASSLSTEADSFMASTEADSSMASTKADSSMASTKAYSSISMFCDLIKSSRSILDGDL